MTSKKKAVFGVPNFSQAFQLPDLTHLVEAFRPPSQFVESIRALQASWEVALEPLREPLTAWSLEAERCEVFEKAGWLPHWSTPFHLIDDDKESFDERVHEHFRNVWPVLRLKLEDSVRQSIEDQETLACYREALDAHSHGLYRASTRTLFPELERISRITFHADDPSKRVTSQHDLIEAVGKLSPDDMKSRGMPGFRLFMTLARHAYDHANTADEIARFELTEIPNRHAALHGIRSYNSLKSSLNSLFFFDFVADVVDIILSKRPVT